MSTSSKIGRYGVPQHHHLVPTPWHMLYVMVKACLCSNKILFLRILKEYFLSIIVSHPNMEINIFDIIHFSVFGILVPNCNITPSFRILVPKVMSASNYDVIIAIMMPLCFI